MIGPEDFASAPIRSSAGHALTYEETERRLEPVLARVPITRVYDATALDWLGVPVWAAVTPLALDLTVHAGKGQTHTAARISATMEAIERVCAEDVDPRRVRHASFAELGGARSGALDPELFDLPFQTSYRPDRPLDWICGYDLIGGRQCWVALDLVLSPPRERVCCGVETNGLAAGNNHTEAALHAVHELIERDAFARDRFMRRYADEAGMPPIRVIERQSLPSFAAGLLRGLRDRGLPAIVEDLTHDIGVPVFRATIFDGSFPGREGRATTFDGMGADLDPISAVSRAICEAVQSHTVTVVGARDSVEDDQRHARRDTESFVRRLTTPTSTIPFPDGRGNHPPDLAARLEMLLERLLAADLHHCIVVDLTRDELGIPVVRVLVPGLSGPYGDTSRRPARRLLRTIL